MPLSEDEQRILQDIERNFYEQDPEFAKAVSRPGLYKHARRNLRFAVVGFVVGLVVMVATFVTAPVVGFLGFIVMLLSTAMFVQNFKHISTAGLRDVAASDKAKQMNESIDAARERLRRHFPKR